MITQEQATWFSETFGRIVSNIEQAVLGKRLTVELAVACLLSEGHLLLDDVPGTGKTLLARAVSNTVQGSQKRIQFTPDLLPGDITGVSIFNQKTQTFEFRQGPIFATIVLADEINRASPKTQSALLEVMEEGRVTVDGVGHPVPVPFMVIATQNPIEQAGTYKLPEAQLDRFLMRTSLGYPDHESKITLLADAGNRHRSNKVAPLVTSKAVIDMAELAASVHVDTSLLSYMARIAEQTRRDDDVRLGVSVRGLLGWVRASKTWAAVHGRTYVLPDDAKQLALPVLAHRVILSPEAEFRGVKPEQIVGRILAEIDPPTERAA